MEEGNGVVVKSVQHHVCLVLGALLASIALFGCGGKEERRLAHLARGNAYLAQHEYQRARTEFRNVLLIDQNDPNATYLMAVTSEQLGRYDDAVIHYRRANELAPTRPDAKVGLGRLYLFAGENAQADKLVDEVLAKQADYAEARTLRVALLARNGDMQGAMSEARAVLARQANNAEASSLLAGIHTTQGDFDNAEQVLRRAMEHNADSVSLRLNLVSLLERRDRLEEIGTLLEEVVAIEPWNFDHRLRLATHYGKTDRFEAGEQILRRAIVNDGHDERRYLALAQFLADHKRWRAGETELRRALVSLPRSTKLRLGLATLHEATGQPDAAARVYVQVIELTRTGLDWRRACNRLAGLLLAKDEVAEAAKLISRILEEDPRDADALLALGRLTRQQNEGRKAIGELRAVRPEWTGLLNYSSMLSRTESPNARTPH